jgi:hypothetical protein
LRSRYAATRQCAEQNLIVGRCAANSLLQVELAQRRSGRGAARGSERALTIGVSCQEISAQRSEQYRPLPYTQ